MTTLRTHALLLRSVDFGESDRIVHLLTRDAGRTTAIAKGARRSRKRFPGALDYFQELRVQIERRRPTSMPRLDAARVERSFLALREDPRRFALGCYLLELVGRLAPEGGAAREHRSLYAFAASSLALVDAEPPDARLRTLLELRALDALGLRPELAACVRCGRRLGRGDAAPAGFHVADGGPVCLRCAPAGMPLLPVHLGTLRALAQSLQLPLDRLGRLALGGNALEEARALAGRFLRFHVGLELRSQPFLDGQLTRAGPEGKLGPSRASRADPDPPDPSARPR